MTEEKEQKKAATLDKAILDYQRGMEYEIPKGARKILIVDSSIRNWKYSPETQTIKIPSPMEEVVSRKVEELKRAIEARKKTHIQPATKYSYEHRNQDLINEDDWLLALLEKGGKKEK
jgi:hypothetical protein